MGSLYTVLPGAHKCSEAPMLLVVHRYTHTHTHTYIINRKSNVNKEIGLPRYQVVNASLLSVYPAEFRQSYWREQYQMTDTWLNIGFSQRCMHLPLISETESLNKRNSEKGTLIITCHYFLTGAPYQV